VHDEGPEPLAGHCGTATAPRNSLTNAEIAEQFVVSTETVKTHVGNVLTKLGARDRTQAVITAYESGFISPRETSG